MAELKTDRMSVRRVYLCVCVCVCICVCVGAGRRGGFVAMTSCVVNDDNRAGESLCLLSRKL